MPADNELDAEQEMIRQALEESRKEYSCIFLKRKRTLTILKTFTQIIVFEHQFQ